MTDLDDLVATVEGLRNRDFPNLPAQMVEAILRIEVDHVEDRGPAPRLIEAAIDSYLQDV
ncbi:MAG: hypothetical protein M3406_08860 [Chloroflexota bacterium]|nr:hypothetical protein [Chloroflexota bacterium]